MIYSTENIFIQELCLVLEDGKLVVKMSTAESQRAFVLLSLSYFPSPAVPTHIRADTGWEKAAWMGSTELSISAVHTFMNTTIPHTLCSFLVKLDKAPPSQQNPSVANIAKWERICTAENVTNVGDMLEEGVLGQHYSAPWQERRIAMATALQPESCSDDKLQHITLEVRVLPRSHFHGQEVHFHRQMWLQSSLNGSDRKSLIILHTHPCTL